MPLLASEEAAPSPTSDAAVEHLINDLLGRHAVERLLESLEAAQGDVFVDVEGIEMSVALSGDAILTAQKRVDALGAFLLRNEEDIVPRLVGMEGVNLVEDGIAETTESAGWSEVMKKNLLHLVWLDVGIAHNVAVGHRHIDEGHLIACADTGDRLDAHMDAQVLASLHHSGIDLSGATRLTAVLHAQTDFTLNGLPVIVGSQFFLIRHHRLELVQDLTHPAWLHMSEDFLVNLHHGRQGTASEARHLLDGVESVGSGDVIALQLQLASEGIIDVVGTLHMARCADADLDDMFAVGNHPQLRIECRHTDELGTVNVRQLIQTVERIGRQIVELLLNGLQERDDMFTPRTNPVDDGIRLAIYDLFVIHAGQLFFTQYSDLSVRTIIMPSVKAGVAKVFSPVSNDVMRSKVLAEKMYTLPLLLNR